MSAIYGAINLTYEPINSEIGKKYLQEYSNCKIDRFESSECNNFFMGCGIQYFTKEAEAEVLPIYDEENQLVFTADCFLTNKDELSKLLGSEPVPDGTLIYKSYLKWHEKCVNYIRGSFAFAVYDINANKVQLFADHFSTRCLFFHLRDNALYFSTLFFPMISASGLKYKENERWLAESLSMISPVIISEPRETAYLDVLKVECGHYVEIQNGKYKYVKYYNPVKDNKVNNKLTPEDVRTTLHKTLNASVKNSLRSSGNTAIKLSSGLDSTTIAGFAAPILAERGEKLYSYTSIPLKDSNVQDTKYLYHNETEGVLKFCEWYPNIVPHFEDCFGMNILDSLDDVLDIWELPCKSQQNAVWISYFNTLANKDGCRIMLSGSTGNCTLSTGFFESYVYDLIVHLKFKEAKHTLLVLSRIFGFSPRKYLKHMCKDISKYYVNTAMRKTVDVYKEAFTNPVIGEKYQLTKKLSRKIYLSNPIRSRKRIRKSIYLQNGYSQIGEIDTKQSLNSGVLQIDPLRDVDFINFCCTLPIKYFANEKYDRRLVREFLDDVVPDFIRLNMNTRGVQSGDNNYRLSLVWKNYEDKMKSCISAFSNPYVNESKFNEVLANINSQTIDASSESSIRLIVDCYSFCSYLGRLRIYE